MKNTIAATFAIATLLTGTFNIQAQPTESKEQRDARMAWWREARFGMFIHWGVYSQAGGEWKGTTNHAEWLQLTAKIPIAEYTELAWTFNPVKFDAEAWAQVAKEAGMKYLVITTKHHDGFAMFDSPSDAYNIVKVTPFKRDPLKELAAACRKQGIQFCVYYSLGRDWHDPDVPTGNPGSPNLPPGSRSNLVDFPDESSKVFSRYFERKVKPQVRELLTQLGPIGILWFDTPEKIRRGESQELLAMIRQLQPACIVNERIGNGLGDYGTPEQEIPSAKSAKSWETCMTLNEHWGYNKSDQNWKSTETLLRNLIDIASKGGNYLLNVGPTGEGLIPQPSIERLREIGAWLKVNGEAIYGTGMTPFGPETGSFSATETDKKGKPLFTPAWVWRCTTKPGKIYLHLFEWPQNGAFEIPAMKGKITKAYLLADPRRAELKVTQTDSGVSIALPEKAPDAIASVVCVETKR
jgi:alpha-L-fucosidase